MKIAVWFCGQPRRLQQLIAAVACVYLVFRLTSPFLPDESQDVPTALADDPFPGNMVAAINSVGGSGDNLDLRLTLNIKSLMTYMDTQEDLISNKKATPDAVQADVDIMLQDTKRCDDIPEMTWLVYVHTQPHRGNKRMLLRKTWANEKLFKQRNIRVLYVMGSTGNTAIQREIWAEFARHRDILQGNFTDDEYSGPVKARMALKWVATYCAKARYILKVEDDTFVDIFWLMDIVKKQQGHSHLIVCPLWPEHSRLIQRDPRKCNGDNIWCLRYTEFPGMTHFPQYCDAIGYLVSRDMASKMFRAVPTTAFFWLEQVYMTAMLPSREHVEYVDLFKNYTTRPIRAYKDTVKLNKRIYVFSKVPYAPNFEEIWLWTLKHLRLDEVDLLSEDIIAQIPRVEKKLTTLTSGAKLNKP